MSTPNVTKACLRKLQNGQPSGDSIPVHFNPSTLQYTIENTLSDQGGQGGSGGGGGGGAHGGHGSSQDQRKTQYVSQSTGKLSMDLIYDTTDSGDDVRLHTQKVGKLMQPEGSGNQKVPPVVQFEWGMYSFKGMLQQYQETIEFFSSDGVPLRATVKITITAQSDVFDEIDPAKAKQASVVATPQFDSATAAATRGGDPNAGRSLAAANNLDSMRFTGGASLTVDSSVELKPPAAFSSGSSGMGGGAGLSLGGGGGLSIGGSAGLSVGGGASLSFGGSASAGVSATAGAFAGLRASAGVSAQTNLDASRMQRIGGTTDFTTDSSATFSLGGQASMKSSTGLSAEVGTSRSLRDVIKFED